MSFAEPSLTKSSNEAGFTRFVVTGLHFAGCGILRRLLRRHPQIVMLGEVLHESDNEIRRISHQEYFDDDFWCDPNEMKGRHYSTFRYLDHKIWNEIERDQYVKNFTSRHKTKGIGIQLSLEQLQSFDLWDFLADRESIKVIQVSRNPVSLLTASLQRKLARERVQLNIGDVEKSIDDYLVSEAKLKGTVDGFRRMHLEYRDLLQNPERTLERAFQFLGVRPKMYKTRTKPRYESDIRSRIVNLEELEARLSYPYNSYVHKNLL